MTSIHTPYFRWLCAVVMGYPYDHKNFEVLAHPDEYRTQLQGIEIPHEYVNEELYVRKVFYEYP